MKRSLKIISVAAVPFLFHLLATSVRASDIKESDYPVQYQVIEAATGSSKLRFVKSCSMTLRDQAKPNVALNVTKGGGCEALVKGKVYRGRENQKKNEIELVITVGGKKARVEDWQLIGTADISPSTQ